MSYLKDFDLRQIQNFELLAKQVVEGFIIGLHKSPFHGFSVEFAEHRLYNVGDSIKNIDWKVYGRTDKLFVKQFEEETNLRCQIVIDTSSSMYFPKELEGSSMNKLQFSSIAAASLMNLLQKQRDAFGLSLFDEKVHIHTKPKSSTKHYRLMLNHLENLIKDEELDRKTSATDALHRIADSTHRRSLVMIFSDMFEDSDQEKLFTALQHLKYNKHELVLFHVVDKNLELDFNFDNRPHEFIDMESGERIKLQSNQIKEHFIPKMVAYKEKLIQKCLQFKIDYVEADINEGFHPILERYLVKRKKMMN